MDVRFSIEAASLQGTKSINSRPRRASRWRRRGFGLVLRNRAAQSGSTASQNGKSPDRESLWEVRLADRSKVRVRPITKDIEIKTRYGNLQVPVTDVRRIEVGIRRSEEMEKRVAAAIDRLGDPNESVRDGAERELVGLRERAYSALIRAAQVKIPRSNGERAGWLTSYRRNLEEGSRIAM